MKLILPLAVIAPLLVAAGCSDRPVTTPGLAASQEHVQYGSGPLAYPTSIYDPSRLNDPTIIEDQERHRGNKMLH